MIHWAYNWVYVTEDEEIAKMGGAEAICVSVLTMALEWLVACMHSRCGCGQA